MSLSPAGVRKRRINEQRREKEKIPGNLEKDKSHWDLCLLESQALGLVALLLTPLLKMRTVEVRG